jgi:hypothetical protein
MEEIPQNWSDVILDDIINSAYHIAQKELMKVDPESFLEWVRRDVEPNESFYARPEGSWWPNQVRMLEAASGKYVRLDWKPFDEAEDWTGEYVWSRRGIYVCIFPEPPSLITNGLELIHVPTMTLTADTDIPKIPLGLHLAIVYLTKIIALGETYQNFSRDVEMVEKVMGDISTYYLTAGGQPIRWRPDIVKAIGYAG